MPIDPSIIQIRPVRSLQNHLADAMNYETASQNNQMNRAKLDAYARDQERQNKLLSVLGGLPQGATDEDRIGALQGGGYFDEADKVQKGVNERTKTKADAQKAAAEAEKIDFETKGKKLDIAGSAFRTVMQNPTLETAHSVLDYLGSNGIFSPEQVAGYKQQVAADPTSIGRLAETAFRSALAVKDQLLKESTRNTGGKTDTITVDPVSGATKVTNSVTNTQSPDSIASNARIAAEGAANRGVQMRGQDLTDSRQREANATAAETARIAAGNKPLTDAQSKALLFGSRMREADKVLGELAKSGTETSVPGSRSGYGIGSVVTALSSAPKQQIDQAKRDFVNAVLRRESGAVIADSEFDNADKQYFPQIGDSEQVKAQKAKNRQLAINGILAEVPDGRRDSLSSVPGGHPPEITNLLNKYK